MSLALWRDIAVVWLALFCFIGMVVPLAIAFFAVKGFGIVLDRTPELLGKVRGVSRRVRDQSDAGSRQVVARIEAAQRRVQTVAGAVRRPLGRRAPDSR